MNQQNDEFYQYLFECLNEPAARPATAVDKRLLALISYIQQPQMKEWSILDYGCGNGILLTALASKLPVAVINHMHYVGLDPDDERLAATRQEAERLGLSKQVNLATPLTHFSTITDQRFNLILAVNVLHELPVQQAPWILCALLRRLCNHGLLVIADMEKLPEGESNYVCWDKSNFVGFKTPGINFRLQETTTQRTCTPIFTATMSLKRPKIDTFDPDGFDPRNVAEITVDTFREKHRQLEQKMADLIGKGKERTRDFAIYLTEYRNLTSQLRYYFGTKPNGDSICPVCQCWLIYGEEFDIEWEDSFNYMWCPLCKYEEGTHYGFGYHYIDGHNVAREIRPYDRILRRRALARRRKQAIKFYGLEDILELKTRIWDTTYRDKNWNGEYYE